MLEAIDNKTARHSTKDLIVDEAVSVGVIPERARALAAGGGNTYLLLERLAGMHVDEIRCRYFPAATRSCRESAVRLRVWQVVTEGDPHRIAETRAQQRRYVGAVVEQARKFAIANTHGTRYRRDCGL